MTRLQKLSPLISRRRKKAQPIIKGYFIVTSDNKIIITSNNEKIIVDAEPDIELIEE